MPCLIALIGPQPQPPATITASSATVPSSAPEPATAFTASSPKPPTTQVLPNTPPPSLTKLVIKAYQKTAPDGTPHPKRELCITRCIACETIGFFRLHRALIIILQNKIPETLCVV